MSKQISAASIALIIYSAGAALAADLPSRKDAPVYVPPPPLISWNGFYVGLNAGGGWSNSSGASYAAGGLVDDPLWFPATPFAASATGFTSGGSGAGFIGGGQLGYNYQFNNSFLVGLEADFQGVAGGSGRAQTIGAAFNGFTGSNAVTFTEVNRGLDWIGTVRGRVGWLFTPTLLLYGTGGFAYGGASLSIAQTSLDDQGFFGPGFGSASFNSTATGWTAGGGLEWMFLPNWSAKVEYLYYDLGRVTGVLGPVSGLNFTAFAVPGSLGFANLTNVSARYSGNIVRAGVNYHFNWGSAPVVAKY